jgi:hypothetical protein
MARTYRWHQPDGTVVTLLGWRDGGAVPSGFARILTIGGFSMLVPLSALAESDGNVTMSVSTRFAEMDLALALLALILVLLAGCVIGCACANVFSRLCWLLVRIARAARCFACCSRATRELPAPLVCSCSHCSC